MKLILCTECNDIVRLIKEKERFCYCRKSSGQYINDINAWYVGEHCIPLEISNPSLIIAIIDRKEIGDGVEFKSFVVLKNCKTFINKGEL